MKTQRADTVYEEGFFPWPRQVPAAWILKAHPVILSVAALVLYHQFAPLPESPFGFMTEIFVLTTAYSLLAGRGRKKPKQASPDAGHGTGPQSGTE